MGYDLHEKGVPTINEATCTGCGLCAGVCGDQVLQVCDGKARTVTGGFMGCIACGHCMAICPTGSVTVTGRGMTPDDAVELPPAVQRATADQLEALLLARRSIRRFTNDEIDRTAIDRILAMTSTAPMGIPPSDVGVVVFHGRERVQAFAADACAAFEKLGWFFSPLMLALMRPFFGKEGCEMLRSFVKPLMELLVAKRKQGEDWFAYDAPATLLFHYGPMSDATDCTIAATYAMLAVESLGLGSCMLGTVVGLNNAKPFKQKYGIPAKNKFGVALVLGHPAVKFRRGVRRRFESLKFA